MRGILAFPYFRGRLEFVNREDEQAEAGCGYQPGLDQLRVHACSRDQSLIAGLIFYGDRAGSMLG